MKKISYCILLFLGILPSIAYGQYEIGIYVPPSQQFAYVDTFYLFLDDTNYYVEHDNLFANDNYVFTNFFPECHTLEYELKDSLPDGYYILYDLKKNETKRANLYNYILCDGGYKNGMRHGIFHLYQRQYDINEEFASIIHSKSITFVNGVVDGIVKETQGRYPIYLGHYEHGIPHGAFYFSLSARESSIIIYDQGKIIRKYNYADDTYGIDYEKSE